jgi:hypothetical protein
MLPLAALLGLAAASAPPVGAATAPTFSVTYVATADCPSQATFEAAVLARAPRARKVADGANLSFEAQLTPAEGHARQLRITLADGSSESREIVADGCAEAMQSMAIIAAMMLEAQSTETQEGVEEPKTDATVEIPAAVEAPPPESAIAIHADHHDQSKPAKLSGHEPATWLTVALGGVMESAAAPSAAFGVAVAAELGLPRSGWAAPSLRLSLVGAQGKTVETSAGDARFRLALGRLNLCGLGVGSDRASLKLCAAVEAGALFAQGINARNSRGQTMPWLGGGPELLGSVGLTRTLALDVSGGGRALLIHDDFVFAPGTTAHQVPVFAWNFGIGLSYRAW